MIFLSQEKMSTTNSFPTPIVCGLQLSCKDGYLFSYPQLYRSVVGEVEYATITHPKIVSYVKCVYIHACPT